jgi:hypothetical protein
VLRALYQQDLGHPAILFRLNAFGYKSLPKADFSRKAKRSFGVQ